MNVDHAEAFAMRKAIADYVCSGKKPVQAMIVFECSIGLVYKACREHAVPVGATRPRGKPGRKKARPRGKPGRKKARWNENGFLEIDLSEPKEARKELQELLAKLPRRKADARQE